jgi:hypothetical protein
MNKYKDDFELLNSKILEQWFQEKLEIKVYNIDIEEYENDTDILCIRIRNDDCNLNKLLEISKFLSTTNISFSIDGDYKLLIDIENWNFSNLKSYKIYKQLQG